jgi:bacterioferritin (cytochrome b1)
METLTRAEKEAVLDVLNMAFTHRFHSVADYILNANPYVAESEQAALHQVEAIAQSDREAAERLADVIEGLEGIPQVSPFHHDIATLNYLSIHHLKNVLRESLASQLAAYEQRLRVVVQCRPAYEAMLDLCDQLRSQIDALRDSALVTPGGG